MGLYFKGESGLLIATRISANAAPYQIGVYDFKGTRVSVLSATENQGNGTVTYALPTQLLGYFELRPMGGDANALMPKTGSRPAGRLTYAVVNPADANRSRGFTNIFANIQGAMSLPNSTRGGYEAYPYLGISSVGTKEYSWFMCNLPDGISPTPDAACDRRLANDANPALFAREGLVPIFYMEALPASELSAAYQSPPVNPGRYSAFMGKIAAHIARNYDYLPVHYYQMSWEPDLTWKSGDSELIALFKLAYEAIHAADPKAMIMGPTFSFVGNTPLAGFSPIIAASGPLDTLRRLLTAGLANYLDAISWHDYPSYDPEKYYKPELTAIESDMLRIRQIARDLTGKDLKLLGTEGGFMCKDGDLLGHAYANTSLALLAKAAGAEQHTYFFLADYTYEPGMGIMFNLDSEHYADPPLSFFVRKASPKPEFPMIRQVNDVVAYADLVARSDSLGGAQNIRSYVYRNRESAMNTLIVWDPTDQNRTIQLNIGQTSVRIADVFGNVQMVSAPNGILSLPLQRHPTYLMGLPANVLSTN